MLFENNNFDYDFDMNLLNLAGLNFKDSTNYFDRNKILDAKEGYLRGNMWSDEYVPYKNMKYAMIKPTNERENLLLKVMETEFAVNDLNLYLDLHPEDIEVYNKFKKYVEECIKLKDEYSKKFGPLTLSNDSGTTYDWLKNPWPWDNQGGSMYV